MTETTSQPRPTDSMPTIKVLIATGLYPPDIGGPATYTKMLEEFLPAHGFALSILPFGCVRGYPRIIRHLIYTWRLLRESSRADIVYALDPVSVGVPTYLVHCLTRKPYLIRIAGDYAWEQGQQRFGVTESLDAFVISKKRQHFFVRLLSRLQTRITKCARHVIVPSEYMKRIVSAWGIDTKAITVIYSALHPLHVDETREEIRTMFQYDGYVIVTAARLVPWKGIKTLIECVPELAQRLTSIQLIIIGDGPQEAELKARAAELGIEDSVRFVGRMPKDTLGAALKGADVFVLNTSYEGMSHQLIEVMDLGVPIVATAVGGNTELITDGVDGMLVPYDDREAIVTALVHVLTNDHVRTKMTLMAKLRSERFSRTRVVSELASLIRTIL